MAWRTGHIPIVERKAREDTAPEPAPIEVLPIPPLSRDEEWELEREWSEE
jgi:hypothetical protein